MKTKIVLCGPSLSAVSGVSTHLNQLLNSSLNDTFNLQHFQVGSEGRNETKIKKLWRLVISPFQFMVFIHMEDPTLIMLNTSLNTKAFWRDFIYLLIAKSLSKKIVYQVHGGELPDKFLGRNLLSQWFTGFCLRLPDAIVLLAKIEMLSYRKYKSIKYISVIPNAIDVTDYSHIEQNNYNKNIINIGYIGRLAYGKGIRESILAVNALKNRSALVFKYYIAGAGPQKNELHQLINELKLNDDIILLSSLFNKDKIKFWQDTDIFLFPTHHEGLPYTILEALASGTPVITSRVGGIPDAITDNVHGVFVKPHDINNISHAIDSLVSDRKKLREMSLACIKRAHEDYTIERLASQFEELFIRVLNN